MAPFVLARLLQGIPVLFGVSILAWALVSFAPGDAATIYAQQFAESGRPTADEVARARADLHLDGSPVERYGAWLGHVARGDMGRSFTTGTPITTELRRRAVPTLQLALAAAVIMAGSGLTLGIAAAVWHGSAVDGLSRVVALASGALPSFWLALIFIWLFAVRLQWLPSLGRGGLDHLVLPAATLGLSGAGAFTRLVRASMLDVLRQEYIRAARARGLRELRVITRHALRNALTPVVTQLGLSLGALLGGAAVVETIFAWPGLGKFTVDAIAAHDYPAIQAVVLVSATTYVLIGTAVDITYRSLDPRFGHPVEA